MKKVSIVMPSLNIAAYIKECMDSVLEQTIKDIEVICVDAGSTDGTWEILQDYASSDDRVRLIRSEIKSYGHQMNLGLAAAEGEYIGIVETDDYIEKDMFATLYLTASDNDADIVKSGFDMFTTDRNGIRVFVDYSLKRHNRMEYDRVYSCEDYFSGLIKPECYIWNAIYKKDFLKKNNVKFNETPGASFQDFGFRYQTAFFADRILAVNRSFYHYRRDNVGASTYCSRTAEYNYRETCFTLGILKAKAPGNDRLMKAFALEAVEFAIWPYIEILKWSEPADSSDEALRSYRELFAGFVEKGYVTAENTENRLWWLTNFLLEGEEVFKGAARVFARLEVEKVIRFTSGIKEKKDIIIFGSGMRGRAVYSFLINNGYTDIRAFCDNNTGNTELFGVRVMKPEKTVQEYPEAYYILTSPSYEKDMRMQLHDLGVEDDRISLYPLLAEALFCTNRMMGKTEFLPS